MKKYKTIFFDLDHTLWDFETNSGEALAELFDLHDLGARGIPGANDFISTYREINHRLWNEYHRNVLTKEKLRAGRFRITLEKFGIVDGRLVEKLSEQYLQNCPVKTHLFPGTIEVLNYLDGKYSMHIITNGFKEVQYLKIRNSGLEKFFSGIYISEEIGFKKPEPEIFHHAVKRAKTVHEHCIMIGDNLETDIAGAENAGIDSILFNPGKISASSSLKQIHNLAELLHIL